MKRNQLRLLFFCMLFSIGVLPGRAWPAVDNTCVKHITAPNFPRLPWFAQLTGTVEVDVDVDTSGRVRSAVASGAHNLLNRAAEENIREWTFCSAAKSFKLKMTYIYRLEGRKEHEQSPPKVSLDLPDRVEILARPPEPEP
jgi:TonB family protein